MEETEIFDDIFSYYDGEKETSIDAWRCAIELFSDDLVAASTAAEAGDKAAINSVIDAVARAFNLKLYDPVLSKQSGKRIGLSGLEVMRLFGRFAQFQEQLKKKLEDTQTLQASTEPAS